MQINDSALTTNIKIDDTTLRDGEQTAGVVFSNAEKVEIAKRLDDIGVHQIEAGIPAMEGDEKEVIKEIAGLGLKASVLAWNRAVISDIQHSIDTGVSAIAVSIAVSDIHIETKLMKDRQWVLDSVKTSVDFAKKHNLYVSVNAEDGSRAEPEFLMEFAKNAESVGADRIRLCDTVGVLEPFRTYELVKMLKEATNLEIEMHMHNDFGMATANTLAGLKAGAIWVNTTVNGLGERAGNAALEEVVMSLRVLENIDLGIKTQKFLELSEYVAKASSRTLPVWKTIVGAYIFAHESGIHADGVIKNPKTYEAFSPEDVGSERQLVIGKHSGTHSIKMKLQEFGVEINDEDSKKVLDIVRRSAIEHNRALFDKELMGIYQEYMDQKAH